jgi:hypothetical protein
MNYSNLQNTPVTKIFSNPPTPEAAFGKNIIKNIHHKLYCTRKNCIFVRNYDIYTTMDNHEALKPTPEVQVLTQNTPHKRAVEHATIEISEFLGPQPTVDADENLSHFEAMMDSGDFLSRLATCTARLLSGKTD